MSRDDALRLLELKAPFSLQDLRKAFLTVRRCAPAMRTLTPR